MARYQTATHFHQANGTPHNITHCLSMPLTYVTDAEPGYTRRKSGKGFSYYTPDGDRVTDKVEIARINALGIPPAYTQVWICTNPEGHLQATGRDAKGRKQYRYHPDWTVSQNLTKYSRMVTFAQHLPRIRRHIRAQMNQPGLGRAKIIATAINLLEVTLIRIGNEDYARTNKSYGLTTLRNRHVQVKGQELRFRFIGKSGKEWNLSLTDHRVAKVIRACQELPGQRLFQYKDEDGEYRALSSHDINDYLRELTGDDISAKDFRTWAGTVLAYTEISKLERPDSLTAIRKCLTGVVKQVAAKLGNTPAICRKCYIHPAVFQQFETGVLVNEKIINSRGLTKREQLTLAVLQSAS
ncbi:MAG: DNA topoisomerase IB [Blastochloris viridis]|uniref:DNA topoisomerase n=1 Tax=Blastochloris viridis TaxID=1079 RepID=A0A6N4RBJ9_BLAVI|nr:MAG: DNA topoisomerase IB [Blastochloris viridis]